MLGVRDVGSSFAVVYSEYHVTASMIHTHRSRFPRGVWIREGSPEEHAKAVDLNKSCRRPDAKWAVDQTADKRCNVTADGQGRQELGVHRYDLQMLIYSTTVCQVLNVTSDSRSPVILDAYVV